MHPRLPDGWRAAEAFVDTIAIGEVPIGRVGLSAVAPDGAEVTGAAAAVGAPPAERAGWELVERIATFEWMRGRDRPLEDASGASRVALSNGVALHATWAEACARARWELAERHAVLRAWFGDSAPERIAIDTETPLLHVDGWDVRAYLFPDDGSSRVTSGLTIAGVFALPRRPELPLAMGFAARPSRPTALRAALDEALQSGAFLWGEAAPIAPPVVTPSAMGHLEYFQWPGHHRRVSDWLEGAHRRYAGWIDRVLALAPASTSVTYDDLTPDWAAPLRVAKANCGSTIPLVFGTPAWAGDLPPELRVHPIA